MLDKASLSRTATSLLSQTRTIIGSQFSRLGNQSVALVKNTSAGMTRKLTGGRRHSADSPSNQARISCDHLKPKQQHSLQRMSEEEVPAQKTPPRRTSIGANRGGQETRPSEKKPAFEMGRQRKNAHEKVLNEKEFLTKTGSALDQEVESLTLKKQMKEEDFFRGASDSGDIFHDIAALDLELEGYDHTISDLTGLKKTNESNLARLEKEEKKATLEKKIEDLDHQISELESDTEFSLEGDLFAQFAHEDDDVAKLKTLRDLAQAELSALKKELG